MKKIAKNDRKRYTSKMKDIVKAAYDADHDRFVKLLSEGESINSVDPKDNLSCLHIACMQGDNELVDIILEWNSSKNDLDFNVRTNFQPRFAWQYALQFGHYDIAKKVEQAQHIKTGPTGPSISP